MARVGQEEDLLRQLAELERETRDADPISDERWDLLSAGTLDEAAEGELRQRAASSEGTARALELFRPIPSDIKSKMTEMGVAAVREGQNESVSTASAPEPELEPPTRLAPRDTRGSPARRSRRPNSRRPTFRLWLAAAAVLVSVLASIPLLTGFLGPGSPEPGEPELLASYRLEVDGGLQTVRSTEDPPVDPGTALVRLAPGIRFTVTLVPEVPVARASSEPPLKVHAFLSQGPVWQDWPRASALAELSDQGAIRISTVYGQDLLLDQGRWTLWLPIGHWLTMPSLEEVRSVAEGGLDVETKPWRLQSVDLEILGEPSPDGERD